jgi:hypothetical protein
MKRFRLLTLVAAVFTASLATSAEAANPSIQVLSNRADLISAGDALVRIDLPKGVSPQSVRVSVGSRDVSGAFAVRPNGHFEGILTDLADGANVVTARMAGNDARITIVNHPNGGPVFSGPQVKPWVCQDTAKDQQCNEPAKYELRYRSTSGSFAAYDPKSPPSDVATATTDQGKTVPYIVRHETGYQARDQYRIAVLYDPSKPFEPWAPQDGWNHKLLIKHGASCGIERQAADAPDVMDDAALSRGFAVMSTALNNAGHNCNIITQAESMVMAKERVVEQYGPIRYTIGTGCSGGSLTQHQVANAYPGLYQGILPQCSFPDGWSTGQQLAAYNLIRRYVENPSKWAAGVTWSPAAIAAVEGHPNHVNSIVFDTVYWTDLGVPDDGCAGVKAEETYNAETNPGGVRCTLADYMINVFGPRDPSVWSAAEKKLERGFAGLPISGVGVQFGLDALRKGQITTDQFVDLNEKIGGVDIDINPVPQRNEADFPALARAYRSGAINKANNLDQVPIIDLRGPDPGAFHDAYRSWAVRARLEREQGHFRNHVIWFGHTPLLGDPRWTTEGLVAMDKWLAAVEKDDSGSTLADKIVKNRPKDIQDRCSQIPGIEAVKVPGVGVVCENDQVQTRYGTPAMVAGEGVETDINRCQLKPLRRTDYYPVEFTDEQWDALAKAFPTGVCDWSKPGVDMQDTIPWQTYQDASGNVIYGGKPLGKSPRSAVVKERKAKKRKRARRGR